MPSWLHINMQQTKTVGSEVTLQTQQSARVSMSTPSQPQAKSELIYAKQLYFGSTW